MMDIRGVGNRREHSQLSGKAMRYSERAYGDISATEIINNIMVSRLAICNLGRNIGLQSSLNAYDFRIRTLSKAPSHVKRYMNVRMYRHYGLDDAFARCDFDQTIDIFLMHRIIEELGRCAVKSNKIYINHASAYGDKPIKSRESGFHFRC
jgi:hypothetical protein